MKNKMALIFMLTSLHLSWVCSFWSTSSRLSRSLFWYKPESLCFLPHPLKHSSTQRRHSASAAPCLGCCSGSTTWYFGKLWFWLCIACMYECVKGKSRAKATMNGWFLKVHFWFVYSEFSHWISCKTRVFFSPGWRH